MSIFDVFSFKKEAAKVFTAENFSTILELARAEIIKQIKSNIPGPEKKALVDSIIIFKIREFGNGCHNKLVLWVLGQIIKVVPTVTQLVYNFLKEKVENL